MSLRQRSLTAERLREVLNYDPDTGLFSRVAPSCDGRPASTVNLAGYVVIRIDYILHSGHRLAWLYMTGAWPPHSIDHKNGNRSDNRWGNLRAATVAQNNMNRGPARTNKCGYKGVCRAKSGKWRATAGAKGSYHHLGLFDTPEEASVAYRVASLVLHGEFARL